MRCPPGAPIPASGPLAPSGGFALGVYPVTQAVWQAVTGRNPSMFTTGDDAPRRPVERVSWIDAVRFCNALSAALGLPAAYAMGEGEEPAVVCDFAASGFRLPTVAEWEYAARSGGDAFVYAGSDDLAAVGWFEGNSDGRTQPVGRMAATRWGLHDLSGNVWEWCWDRLGDDPSEAATDPEDAASVPERVIRGGAWDCTAGFAVVAFRYFEKPDSRLAHLGLRLARTLA